MWIFKHLFCCLKSEASLFKVLRVRSAAKICVTFIPNTSVLSYTVPFFDSLKPAGRQTISLSTTATPTTTSNTTIATTTTTAAAAALSSVSVRARQNVQKSQEQEIAMIKKQHEEEMTKLRKGMEEEMVREKEKLRTQMDTRLATFKDELQVKQVTSITS